MMTVDEGKEIDITPSMLRRLPVNDFLGKVVESIPSRHTTIGGLIEDIDSTEQDEDEENSD
jgi:hypothetical protein